MFGIGTAEIGIILVIAALLFAPTLVAFWLGYTLGQRRPGPTTAPSAAATPPASGEPPAPAAGEEGGAPDG